VTHRLASDYTMGLVSPEATVEEVLESRHLKGGEFFAVFGYKRIT
jgi:hypothetical protein